ncbi:MAG: dihydrolipoyl dehydrogenase [Bacteroidetes bacterium]|nr:dihydrolipoyl dehydrogenase [Bacteroidota bacterium]
MKFDVTIIGSGPGGYVAAIRCAQLGMNTALVERYPTLGGTCLNVGCIPSKALLDSSWHFFNARINFRQHGIETGNVSVNLQQMIKRKDDVVKQTCDGVRYLMKKNKITVFHGHGSFIDKNRIKIGYSEGKKEIIEIAKTIIATGSKPSALPGVTIDKLRIITSTEALSIREIPSHFIVIGGGIIGVELGSVFSRLGSKVTILEFLDSLVPGMDRTLAGELEKVLRKQGIEIFLNHKVTGSKNTGKGVTVSTKNKEGVIREFHGDYCLVAVGRSPYTQNLGLENAGVKTDAKGRVAVNQNLETTATGIYAIGDVIGGAMLAHKAEEEGIFVAELLASQKPHINYHAIPAVVYTHPEVAGVGYTEEELKAINKKYKTGNFPFRASGRARASMETEGLVKVLAAADTDEILGVHIIGPRASDMIAEAVVALEYRASAEDIARTCHAHPTFTEAFKEACMDATGKRAIHV